MNILQGKLGQVVALGALLAAACGGDETGAHRDVDGSGGADAGVDASSGGTSSGGTSSGGTSSGGTSAGGAAVTDGSVDASPPVICSGTPCTPPSSENVGARVEACCYQGLTCGFHVIGSDIVHDICLPNALAGGSQNPDCPGLEIEKNGTQTYGCCSEQGTCGIQGPKTSFGCLDPTLLGQPPGGACSLAETCAVVGSDCAVDRDCCPLPRGTLCAAFGTAKSTCTNRCASNDGCLSGCCQLQPDGSGACAPAELCAGTCRTRDAVCFVTADCCDGLVCAPQYGGGPSLCSARCGAASDAGTRATTDAGTCSAGEMCVALDPSTGFCAHEAATLCTDTCPGSGDGTCSDGGTGSTEHGCAYGTDCRDCGPRTGAYSRCSDRCGSAKNGECEDGGASSTDAICPVGSDCTDCGPRHEVCSDVCKTAQDGSCDDGGEHQAQSSCALGTDCSDCGPRPR